MSDDLVYRLRKRAEIRRQISTRKSVQEGKPDRIADLLEEAADYIDAVNVSQERVDETAKHKHEPVAWLSLCYTEDGDPLGYTAHEQEVYGSFPVYTTPPHHASDVKNREWVGLTDEERADCWSSSAVQSAINIEAKLKEKNHAD
jgi:hypothetical protein